MTLPLPTDYPMYDAVLLKYHQTTFDLLEQDPKLDMGALALLDQCEAAYGFSFPASIREWYSLGGSVEILREYSNEDNPLTLAEIQELAQDRGSFHGWRDYHGLDVLPIMDENQSVALWAVHLNGSDDPPVLVIDDDDEWKPWSDHFSTFVTEWVWWHLYWAEVCVLCAKDIALSDVDKKFLGKSLIETPRSSYSPIYHFSLGADKHIHVWARDDQRSFWWLRAGSKSSLLELTKMVWQCGTLARTLNITGGYFHICAGKVLEMLRFGHELPEPKPGTMAILAHSQLRRRRNRILGRRWKFKTRKRRYPRSD